MAGTFPNLCGGQQINANGQPLAGATLTVYNGGTLQLSSVFQDIGLAIPGKNPMTTDLTGRIPFFFVADGTYLCVLNDATGVGILSVTLPSIGASSSGGGGSGVDPTTIFQTGDELWRKIGGIRTGWVRQNALTIGSAVSGASERANADCQNLFLYLWNNYPDSKCPVVGGRGANAAADWGANKQITLPDMRGRGAAGADGMGNVRANVLPDGNITSGGTDTGDTGAAFGGEANHVLVANEIPAHTHGVTDPGHVHGVSDPSHNHGYSDPSHTHSNSLSDPGHTHTVNGSGSASNNSGIAGAVASSTFTSVNSNTTGITLSNAAAFSGISINFAATGISINSHTTGITIQSTGGGASHNNMQPFSVGTWYIKL